MSTLFSRFFRNFEAVFFTCRLWLSAHPPTFMYYTYFLLLCQDLFPFFPLIYSSLFLSADNTLKYRVLFLITYFPLMYTMFFVFVLPLAYSFYSYLRFTPALIFYISFTFHSQYYVEFVCQSHYVDIVFIFVFSFFDTHRIDSFKILSFWHLFLRYFTYYLESTIH